MKEETKTILKWKCKECNNVYISSSTRRHDMNICECGKSGVDLEKGYSRSFGFPEPIYEYIVIERSYV